MTFAEQTLASSHPMALITFRDMEQYQAGSMEQLELSITCADFDDVSSHPYGMYLAYPGLSPGRRF